MEGTTKKPIFEGANPQERKANAEAKGFRLPSTEEMQSHIMIKNKGQPEIPGSDRRVPTIHATGVIDYV